MSEPIKKEDKVKKNDFVELKYTGYSDGRIFDSNIAEDLKELDEKAEVKKVILCVGNKMVVPGLDKALEGKEVGKEYSVEIEAKDAFGPRKRELVKTIPLASFAEKKVNPQPGMVLALDNTLAKIVAVSGARVVTDFNNPLAGRDLKYKFTISRKVTDDKEKSETILELLFRFIPENEIKDKKVVVKLPKGLDMYVKSIGKKFKELTGLELVYEEKVEAADKINVTTPGDKKVEEQKA
tara:strand:+ start:3202 stop:3915 length:714 start_codon:yes stop_codon:yes gene_type:complete